MFPVQQILDQLTQLSREEVMRRVGVEPRRGTAERMIPPVGGFGAGFIVGLGAGLLLAPQSGEELRARITELLQGWTGSKGDAEAEAKPKPEEHSNDQAATEEHRQSSTVNA